MDTPPTVSVIIPVFNAERWIAQTLDSVLAQTYQDFEIIAVDDGSTDSSAAAILQRYPMVKYVRQNNAGQAAAFNTGLAAARGEFIAFLDSDDLWAPTKLQASVKALRDYPEAVLCYTNGEAIGEDGQTLWRLLPDDHEPPKPADMLLDCVICCPAQVVVRAKAIEPFTVGLQSNDHDQWVRMCEKGPFIYIASPLTQYRRRDGQMSLNRRQWEDGWKILRTARKRYPYPLMTVIKRAAVIHYRLGQYDLTHGAVARGLLHLAQAGLLDLPRALKQLLLSS